MPHTFIKRACDMTSSERRHKLEMLLMREDTPSEATRIFNPSSSPGGPLPPWHEMGRMMLAEQQDQKVTLSRIERKVDKVSNEMLVFKTKAAAYGTVASACVVIAYEWLKTKFGGR